MTGLSSVYCFGRPLAPNVSSWLVIRRDHRKGQRVERAGFIARFLIRAMNLMGQATVQLVDGKPAQCHNLVRTSLRGAKGPSAT